MSLQKVAIGVDIGGGHIKSAAVDLSDNTIDKESIAYNPVDNQASSKDILSVWGQTLQDTISKIGMERVNGIGFGMPGPFDYVSGIALFENVMKYEGLYNVNVGSQIRNILGLPENVPVRFINDATAFALGEDWVGKGAEYSRVIALALGTGFGSAFIHDGVPVVKGDQVPEIGAVWHLPFKESIANDYISTYWFIKEYEKISGERLPGVKEVAELYDEHLEVQKLFHDYGRNMGEILSPWLLKFQAEILILGGNITRAFPLYKTAFLEVLNSESVSVEIEISDLKENAALLGSARLIDDNYYNRVFPTLKYM
ncbi:ROK family protein [Bacteroidota bacterium]